jgi:RNA recognition motif-containing protein
MKQISIFSHSMRQFLYFYFYKPNSMKLFVAGLSSDFDDIDLKEMFELYGEVISAKVIMDRETGKSRGFGFVDMADDAEARGAIETLDGAGMRGKKMSVKEAEAQQNGGGNRGGGGRDDRGRDNGGYRGGRDSNRPGPNRRY